MHINANFDASRRGMIDQMHKSTYPTLGAGTLEKHTLSKIEIVIDYLGA